MMLQWSDRSTEDQSLFNPTFNALLLRTVCRGCAEDAPAERPMPFTYAFIVLPLIINERARRTLPKTVRTLMTSWATAHPEQIADFGDRARELVDVTREAIQFGCAQDWLTLTAAGLSAGPARLRPDPPKLLTDTDDLRECFDAARFIGRWLPKGGQPSTILSLLGVAP
jgi:hypothetical protein